MKLNQVSAICLLRYPDSLSPVFFSIQDTVGDLKAETLATLSDISKARWDDEMGMAEVVEKKGKLWTTTGIVRNGKIYCSIEEILFLAELGALLLLDDKDIHFSLKDIYGKTVDEKNGCCWELFEVYRHLKSLGYIIQRHGVPWSMKGIKSNCNFDSFQGTSENNGVIIDTELKDSAVVVESLSNLQVDELRPNFDIYLPNSKFRKTSPGASFSALLD
ncbi:hypothetical protein GH714_024994 [Hevea brasiliensis]|uniref:tRNA-splicing endonuclease subunit Sen54 N-terminal domain-containing protein n=1 Tax=Hevea brasiliensis TaxID=3981 RepID=A0A6A6LJ85_HEVBR|nr:hypothetical protein GH714_024994 [Hevea brasiliensis]